MIRILTVTRYVSPLREGGSLPAIVEADDDGLYVLKFRGAGQGTKALIAELVAGELGRSEPDYEIQSLIKASAGLNLGLDYLPGALAFNPLDASRLDPLLASSIVWFDAYVTNVDRTARNTNMLFWHRRLMLIDHGSSLYFHHGTGNYLSRSHSPFPPIKEHVLLPVATALEEADALLKGLLTPESIWETIKTIPESWLDSDPFFADRDAHREAYQAYLLDRLAASHYFVEEAFVHALSSYDYALIRVVPNVERGECINVGALLFSRTQRFLRVRIHLDQARVLALAPDLDLAAIQQELDAIVHVCEGGPEAGPLGHMSQSERFHWLVSPRSTII